MLPRSSYPQIISHRGACGYVPEHSLQAHQLAIDLGTDYVEPDICVTKDLELVVLHDNTLDETTDVRSHPEFADRERNGKFYVYDFRLEELKTLRLLQRITERTTIYNGIFSIPTFSELLDLVQENYRNNGGKTIGIYPELKNPALTNKMFNVSMEKMVLDQLSAYGYKIKGVSQDLHLVQPVVLQSKEEESLITLRKMTDIPLQQLMNSDYEWSSELISKFSTYAQGIGPDKNFLYGSNLDLEAARDRVTMVHDAGLVLHPYTFRREAKYVDDMFGNDADVEAAYFYCCLGIDAVFTEFPDRIRQTIQDLNVSKEYVCKLGGC